MRCLNVDEPRDADDDDPEDGLVAVGEIADAAGVESCVLGASADRRDRSCDAPPGRDCGGGAAGEPRADGDGQGDDEDGAQRQPDEVDQRLVDSGRGVTVDGVGQ